MEYSKGAGLSFSPSPNYCPLLIISPKVQKRVYYGDICYQADVFPTIRALVGSNVIPWCGFGINLLESDPDANRFIDMNTAKELSDKMICSNYFEKIEN